MVMVMVMVMTEKIKQAVRVTEVNKVIGNIFSEYIQLFRNGKMDFKDFVVIENILIKLQTELDKLDIEYIESDNDE